GGPDAGAVARRQLAGLELGAVVAGVRVGDDRPLVAGGGEQAPGPGVDAQRFGPTEFDAAIDRRSGRQLGDGGGDVVDGDELHQPGREPDAPALGAGSAIWGRNSKNCVARRMVWGTP